MKKLLIALSLLGFLFVGLGAGAVAATSAAARSEAGLDQPGPFRRLISGQIGRLLVLRSELNLTSAQRQEIRQILESHRTEIAAAMRPVIAKRRALRDAVSAESPDPQAIRAASTELGKAIGDAAVLSSKVKAEIRSVMTGDQMQKIQTSRSQADAVVDRFARELGNP